MPLAAHYRKMCMPLAFHGPVRFMVMTNAVSNKETKNMRPHCTFDTSARKLAAMGLMATVSFVVSLNLAMADSPAIDTKQSATYARVKEHLDRVPAIDTHDHLRPFPEIPGRIMTERGKGMTLYSLFRNSYYPWINPITTRQDGQSFDDWWKTAKSDFADARATSFYRYQLPAFRDLYGLDFDTISDDDARRLDDRIFDHYKDSKWLRHVITERANIELMFVDPYWARFEFFPHYPFSVLVFNVTTLVRGFHASEYTDPWDSPYEFAKKHKLSIATLDDYLIVLDRMFAHAAKSGAACLKSTLAYQRTLDFQQIEKGEAAKAFGKSRKELTADQIKRFEDFVFWRLCELSAAHNLPFQIHTGQARIQGSNPMLLVDLIESNPKTKFILFHGGFPWIGETGVIVMRFPRRVWVDSVWLPTLSYTMAKRAYHEWLEVMPSDRILWGADCVHAEGIYAATEFTRQCLAEVLAEKIDRRELHETHALRIGRQVLRDNALRLFPQLLARTRNATPR